MIETSCCKAWDTAQAVETTTTPPERKIAEWNDHRGARRGARRAKINEDRRQREGSNLPSPMFVRIMQEFQRPYMNIPFLTSSLQWWIRWTVLWISNLILKSGGWTTMLCATNHERQLRPRPLFPALRTNSQHWEQLEAHRQHSTPKQPEEQQSPRFLKSLNSRMARAKDRLLSLNNPQNKPALPRATR